MSDRPDTLPDGLSDNFLPNEENNEFFPVCKIFFFSFSKKNRQSSLN